MSEELKPCPFCPTPDAHEALKDWEEHLEKIRAHISVIEGKSWELDGIRATLLVNFGATERNTYGFQIEDKGSTHNLMVEVLTKLTDCRAKLAKEGDGK